MAFWTGIKHALNSTLGTKSFMALDQILFAERNIKSSGDDILFSPILKKDRFSTFNRMDEISRIKPIYNGNCIMRLNFNVPIFPSETVKLNIVVKKNGEELLNETTSYSGSYYNASSDRNLSLERGSEYTIELGFTGNAYRDPFFELNSIDFVGSIGSSIAIDV